MSYECENIHENVVNENEWGAVECLQKPTETDLQKPVEAYSQTLTIRHNVSMNAINENAYEMK